MRFRSTFDGLGWRAPLALVLTLLGLGLAAFLTWGHYFDQGAITNSCQAAFGGHSGGGGVVDCGRVTTGSWSSVFGIPVAVLGAVFFLFMLAVNLPWAWRSPSIWVARGRLAATAIGLVFVVFLVAVEALVKHALCVYCTGVHVVAFVLFLVVATGWQDTGWGRFVAAYDAELEQQEEAEAEEEAAPVQLLASNRRAPRAPRSERKKTAAHR